METDIQMNHSLLNLHSLVTVKIFLTGPIFKTAKCLLQTSQTTKARSASAMSKRPGWLEVQQKTSRSTWRMGSQDGRIRGFHNYG